MLNPQLTESAKNCQNQKKALFLGLLLLLLIGYSQTNAQSPQQNPQNLRIAFLTDIHVSPGAASESNLEHIVSEVNEGHYDFAVVTGDVSNSGLDTELITVHRILSKLTIPYHIVPGNHETNWSESACQTFLRLWGNDRFVFTTGPYLFVGFNTGPFLKMGDGHVKEEDVLWLKQTLKAKAAGKIVISLSHYPLGDGLDNWYEITDILKQYNTRLVLCGHGHRLSRHNFDGLPGIMGRAALITGSNIPGYNILVLRNDSAYVYEKRVGQPEGDAFTSFALNDPSPVLKDKQSIARPDTSINAANPITTLYHGQDSASIFTGVTPITPHNVVYGNSKGEVISIDPITKKVNWRNQYTGSIYSTPVYADNILAFGTIDGFIHGVNSKTGQEKWRFNTKTPAISEGLTADGYVYIGSGSSFFKIRLKDGQLAWRNDSATNQLQAKPTLSPDKEAIVFGAWDTHLYCLNTKTGQLRWKWDNGKTQRLYSPGNTVPAIAGDKVFIVAPDRYMTAIDLTTGKTIWRNNSRRVRESMGISTDGTTVFAKTMNDTLIAVPTEGSSFKIRWETNAGFGYEHNPCPILENNGIVYTGTKNGLFIAADANTGKVLREHKAGNSSINKITADKEGNIWISLIEGSLFQYKKL
jgi:outer membrane protein assembly factor BamB/predicted MPP superfamily phosphohydrolase